MCSGIAVKDLLKSTGKAILKAGIVDGRHQKFSDVISDVI